jgi:hypothetical protein
LHALLQKEFTKASLSKCTPARIALPLTQHEGIRLLEGTLAAGCFLAHEVVQIKEFGM